MVYTCIEADNTVAALENPSVITVEIITMNNNQSHGGQSYPRS